MVELIVNVGLPLLLLVTAFSGNRFRIYDHHIRILLFPVMTSIYNVTAVCQNIFYPSPGKFFPAPDTEPSFPYTKN